MKWDGTYFAAVERTVGQRVQSAGYYLLGKIREEVSTAGTSTAIDKFVGTGVIGVQGKVYKAGRRIYNSNPSKPGEAPNRQSGRYRASQAQQFYPQSLTSRVGSPMKLAVWLNLGTARMAARPHYRPVLARESPTLLRVITTGSAK